LNSTHIVATACYTGTQPHYVLDEVGHTALAHFDITSIYFGLVLVCALLFLI